MSLFSKKVKLYAPVDGELTPLTAVDDEVFSTGMMGKGYAINPGSNSVFSPVNGTVTTLFPTKHAIGFKVGEMEILLHMGIDTVELKGAPFEIHVQKGQQVTSETLVAAMDCNAIESSGRSATTMVLITNSADKVKSMKLAETNAVKHATVVATITPA